MSKRDKTTDPTIRKRASLLRIAIPAVLLAVLIVTAALINPYRGSLLLRSAKTPMSASETMTGEAAANDLDYMMNQLERVHPAFIGGVPETVREACSTERTALSTQDKVDPIELLRSVSRVLSPLGDAHTSAWYDGERHYMLYTWENRDNGLTLVKLDGMTMLELFDGCRELFSFELEDWGIMSMTDSISSAEGLRLLGFDLDAGVEHTYENAQGEEITYTYTTADYVPYDAYIAYYGGERGSDSPMPFVRYDIDEAGSTAILTLDSCNYNSEYKACVDAMFRQVSEKDIENVIVDLRGNVGGNSMVANYFVRYLPCEAYETPRESVRLGSLMVPTERGHWRNNRFDDLTFDGEVYCLTAKGSFSSAMMFAQILSDNGLGTLIGETPQNMPTAYGDTVSFQMPVSGLMFTVSCKGFERIDQSRTDEPVTPDIKCPAEDALATAMEVIAKN